ncbi:zinc finger protein 318-like isoform X2 [Pituophis catenifer annectens]|uniref:zinc finger protein 318-like isoform X2 n=1 Tax=Pituophis catenifer annectens TaxID=94852 RepID=UPI003993C44A
MMSEKKEPVSEKVKSPPTAKPKNLEQSVKRENLKQSVKRENLKQSVKRENLEQSVKRENLEQSLKPENLEQSVKPENLEQSVKPENLEQSVKPENLEQSSVEYDKIRDLLKTIGLDIGMAEIDKLAARTEERLHGKKTAYSPNNHSVANHKAKLWERQKHSLSPFDSFPSPEAVSPVLKSDYNNIAISGQNKATDMCEQSGVPGFLIPSAPPSFLDIPPGPISGSCQYVPYVSTFTPTQFFPNSASLPVALPDYDVYQHHMGYATSDWCAQQMNSVYPNKPEVTNHANLKNKCINRNLRIINTITISNSKQFQDASTTAPYSNQRSKSSKKRVRRRKAAETKQTFLKNNDSRNYSEGKKPPESTSKSVNQRSDFLLPYEKASQDGSGFSCILGTTTDSTYAPEKSLDPLPDNIEDEEKFLYGDSNNCFYSQKIMMSEKKEPVSEKVKSPPTAKPKNLVISNSKQFQDASITAPYSNQRSKSSKKRVRRRKAAETKQTFLKNNAALNSTVCTHHG